MALDPKAAQKRLGQLKAARSTHDTLWQEVADFILPSRQFTRGTAPGQKRNGLIFNTAPLLACEQLAGGLHGMLTSPSLRWFALRALPDQARDQAAAVWFEAATDAMYGQFQSGWRGFDVALHEAYLDIAAFGMAVVFIADRGRRGPGFQAVPLAECFISENAERQIDTLYRCYKLPLREVARLWPATIPDALRRQAAERPDQEVEITHAVEPRAGGSGWDSLYCTEGAYLDHERFSEFPYAVPRWEKRSGESYGTGPGVSALADIKMVNKLEELNLRGLAKAIDPAVFLPHDGFINKPNQNPGAFNYYDSGQWRGGNPLFTMPVGRPELAEQKIEQVQQRIRDLFYTTWLSLPSQPNMTATEILQRVDEYRRLMSPFYARLVQELLNPVIERVFAINLRQRLFPPVPPSLQGQGWTVEYMGPLARAQRAADAETVIRVLAAAQPLLQTDPMALEPLDTEATFRFLAERHGMPAALIRSPEALAQRRAERQQLEAMQAQAMALRQGAGAAKDGAQAIATLAGIEGGAAG